MMILCENTYFGQDEILENINRISQAKVLSQICILYRIQKNVNKIHHKDIYYETNKKKRFFVEILRICQKQKLLGKFIR